MASLKRMNGVEGVYVLTLAALALVGLFSPFSYNALPAGPILELTLFVCAASVLRLPKSDIFPFLIIATAYVVGSFVLMRQFKPSNTLDFLQAFKAFIYIIPLCFFYKREIFGRENALRLLKFLLVVFFLKYAYSLALNVNPRMGSRPGLFVENNFELIFLVLYFFLLAHDFGGRLSRWFALLTVVILMSGSRSSALALAIVFYGIYIRHLSLRTFFYLLGFGLITAAVAGIFLARGMGEGLASIDRYRFMLVFLYEIRDWAWWDFIFGSFPITALSAESCRALAFYEGLFSFAEDGSCYSVILHSYFFRVIFDHGIAGLAFLFSFIAFALKGSGYSLGKIVIVIGILSASALSVSAMNSIFVSLALALALGLRHRTSDSAVHS